MRNNVDICPILIDIPNGVMIDTVFQLGWEKGRVQNKLGTI